MLSIEFNFESADEILLPLKTEMEKQALKRHCFHIARIIADKLKNEADANLTLKKLNWVKLKFSESLNLEEGKKNGKGLTAIAELAKMEAKFNLALDSEYQEINRVAVLEQPDWIKSSYPERLDMDPCYQAIFRAFSDKFPKESDLLRESIITYQAEKQLENQVSAAERGFVLASNRYAMLMLRSMLLRMQNESQLPEIFIDTLDKIQAKLDESNAGTFKPLVYIQEAYEILKTNGLKSFQEELNEWHDKILIEEETIEKCYLPTELGKAAGALAFCYQEYIQSMQDDSFVLNELKELFSLCAISGTMQTFNTYREAEVFFQKPEQYNVSKSMCVVFFQNRSFFREYEKSNLYRKKAQEVVQEELIERVKKSSRFQVSRICDTSLFERVVVLPNSVTKMLDDCLVLAQQEGRSPNGVFIVQQILCKSFAHFFQKQFFEDPEFFKALFRKLRNSFKKNDDHGTQEENKKETDDAYLKFLRAFFNKTMTHSEIPQYQELLAMIFSTLVFYQSLPRKKEASAQKQLIVFLICTYVGHHFAQNKLISPLEECVNDISRSKKSAFEVLREAILQSEQFIAYKDYCDFEKIIWGSYSFAYSHNVNPEDAFINELDIELAISRIRKIFPFFKKNIYPLSSHLMRQNISSNMKGKEFRNHILNEARRDFSSIYYNLVCFFVEGIDVTHNSKYPKKPSYLLEYLANILPARWSTDLLSTQAKQYIINEVLGINVTPFGTMHLENNGGYSTNGIASNIYFKNFYLLTIKYLIQNRLDRLTAQEVFLVIRAVSKTNSLLETADRELLLSQFPLLVHNFIVTVNENIRISGKNIDYGYIEKIHIEISESEKLFQIYYHYLINKPVIQRQEQHFLLKHCDLYQGKWGPARSNGALSASGLSIFPVSPEKATSSKLAEITI